MRRQQSLRRSFLFLQGPHGSFFPKLGHALEQVGHQVRRINFNGGDHATWPTGDAFRGRHIAWRAHVDVYMKRHAVTDLVLFGDSRPHHIVAVRQARLAGVRVHVFEEGYIRPDWVTLERDGVNGNSTLSRDPGWYLTHARGLPAVGTFATIPSYKTARGWAAFFYYAEVVLQHWRFPFHGSHRDRNPVWEGITFLRRFRRRASEEARAAADLSKLRARAFFLFPLQLNSDYQIRVHSSFATMHAAIRVVLTSFAAHAPADTGMVIKVHPLDSGLNDWRAVIDRIAAEMGIRDRIAFVEHADLLELVEQSLGMVTVNSTSGTLALAAGKPVKALGDAVYDIPDITDQQPLDRYWSNPVPPDRATYDAFYRTLSDRCLIHGAFLSNAGIDMLVSQAMERLTIRDEDDLLTLMEPHSHA